jgi:hypothetical protein
MFRKSDFSRHRCIKMNDASLLGLTKGVLTGMVT